MYKASLFGLTRVIINSKRETNEEKEKTIILFIFLPIYMTHCTNFRHSGEKKNTCMSFQPPSQTNSHSSGMLENSFPSVALRRQSRHVHRRRFVGAKRNNCGWETTNLQRKKSRKRLETLQFRFSTLLLLSTNLEPSMESAI